MPDIELIVSCVQKWQDTDDYCQAALAYLDKGQLPTEVKCQKWIVTLGKQFELDEYRILYLQCSVMNRRLVYVPECAREAVISKVHLLASGSHISAQKTIDRLQQSFFWPGLFTDATRFCNTCNVCCGRKGQGACIVPELKNIRLSAQLLDLVTIDILQLPTTTKGNRKLLVAIDYLTKYMWCMPMRDETMQSLTAAWMEIVASAGMPKIVLSDNAKNF